MRSFEKTQSRKSTWACSLLTSTRVVAETRNPNYSKKEEKRAVFHHPPGNSCFTAWLIEQGNRARAQFILIHKAMARKNPFLRRAFWVSSQGIAGHGTPKTRALGTQKQEEEEEDDDDDDDDADDG
jgi:hypothetical protein